MNLQKINWFPGHMKKATDEIRNRLKTVDLVIEVVDSRAISKSSNNEILSLLNNKPFFKIALKKDLTNLKTKEENVLIGSIKDKKFNKEILDFMYKTLEPKINKLKTKGVVNPEFLVMIVGLPNVGKSSLINFLKNKKQTKVENRPGVTKNQNVVSLNKNFNLIDTPGVLLKNIDDIETAYSLALIRCIKKEILDLYDVIKFAFIKIKDKLLKYYELEDSEEYEAFLKSVCEKYRFYSKNNELDFNRALNMLYEDISQGKIKDIIW